MRVNSLLVVAGLTALVSAACSSSTVVSSKNGTDAGPDGAAGSAAGGSGGSGASGGSAGTTATGGAAGSDAGATPCSKDTDCGAGQWCNTGAGICQALIKDGDKCGGDSQCKNGHCVSGSCCHTACAAPATCGGGACSCNGAICSAPATCVTWHLDEDGDGHAGTLADVVGCSDQMPTPPTQYAGHKYYQTADDCDDANPNAFPGQTKYFTSPRAGGSYDYNCDGKQEKQYNDAKLILICLDCWQGGTSGGKTCVNTCPGFGRNYGYVCDTTGCGSATVWQSFGQTVACGASGTLSSCGACNGTLTTAPKTQQGCQ